MEETIISNLKDIGYTGELNKESLKTAVEYGAKSIEYTKLVHYLTNEIRPLANVDEEVNPITNPEDAVAFIMEVTSFLKELGCPYQSLIQGHVSDRLQNVNDRHLLLNYLITELMSARMVQHKKPEKKIELKVKESPAASDLKKILIALGFPKPPANLTLEMLFKKLLQSVEEVATTGKELIGNPFFEGFLSEKQWEIIGDVQRELYNEYKIRREMLLTRLDVTIQSFQWSNKTQGKDDYFEKIYREKRKVLKSDPDVDLANLLSARDDVAIIEKTSSATVRKNTGTSIQKVIIGQVPDRGGRTNELAPPPPEMPSWQQRSGPPAGSGGRGGYSRGGGQQNYRGGGQNYSRGGGQQNYSRGGGQHNYSRGGGQQNYSRDGDQQNYSSKDGAQQNYSRDVAQQNYSRNDDQQSYSRGNNYHASNTGGYYNNSSQKSYESSDSYSNSYKKSFDSGSNFSKSVYSSPTYKSNYKSSGYSSSPYKSDNYGTSYSSSNDNTNAGSYGSTSKYSITNQSGSTGYSQKRTFDLSDNSGYSSYGGHKSYDNSGSSDYHGQDQNKKAKSYDDFKTARTTYSDEYARDAQNNEQYHSKPARGRSNYHRGRGGNYRH